MAEERDRWWAPVNRVMSFGVPLKAEIS